MRLGKLIGLFFTSMMFMASTVTALAACPGSGNQITCSGGGLHLTTNGSTTAATGVLKASISVSGAPVRAVVTGVQLTLHGYTALGRLANCTPITCTANRDMGLLLESPAKPSGGGPLNMQVMRGSGGVTGNDQVNPPGPATVTIADGPASSQFPYVGSAVATNWTQTSGTYSPTAVDETDRDGEASPSYGVTIQNSAPPLGPSTTTMNGSFGGASVNGTWNVYLADDAFLLGCPGGCLAAASDIVFTSFDLMITYSAASVGSTTSLTPNLTTPFTTAPNNSVALTATVSGTGGPPTGTVAFTDGGATISGCGAVALSGGTAVCNTTFSSEGVHVLSANYAGDGTFQPSAGAAN